MPNPPSNKLKQAELAKIHIAKKELGMDDDTYRAMLKQLTGFTSSKDLNAFERRKVLEHLKKAGFKGNHPGKPHNLPSNSPRSAKLGKIEALLADGKKPWAYAVAIAKQMYGKERLEFCADEELTGIITALVKDQNKRKAQQPET
jgi:phage gp16-like protein